MITEADIQPDQLLELKRQAAEEGLPLDAVVSRSIERGLALLFKDQQDRMRARAES